MLTALAIGAVIAVVFAMEWGVLDAFLPGGRFNPHTAENVEKNYRWLRPTAYVVAAAIVVLLIVVAYTTSCERAC